jgi:hypothetical protein
MYCWVTLRARWVTLRDRWVTLRARLVTLRARWVMRTQPAPSSASVAQPTAAAAPAEAGGVEAAPKLHPASAVDVDEQVQLSIRENEERKRALAKRKAEFLLAKAQQAQHAGSTRLQRWEKIANRTPTRSLAAGYSDEKLSES